jgi:NAD(P)H-hydrate repair Nnr-like enzyme with NAD(P)H-hydrate epimerase domain
MALDQKNINEFNIKAELLMENARYAAYFALQHEFGIRRR